MSADSAKTTDALPKTTDAPPAGGDNLNNARLPGPGDRLPAPVDTGSQHLPATSIAEAPYNPQNLPGTYKPQDVQYAQTHFNKDEVKALESAGPEQFNKTIDYLQARPDLLPQVKSAVDGMMYLHQHPEVPFNPSNLPGTYSPDALNFARAKGFSGDQIHTLEQWGPDNFNKTMAYLNQNPDKVENMKQFANVIGYWETHPDMPLDPKATHGTFDPAAIKFGQEHGFAQGQLNVLSQFGAENFNNTMNYLREHPDKIIDFQNLANAVGTMELNMINQVRQRPPQQKR